MATAPAARPPDPTVLHPLERLRGTIRRYVALEGLALVAAFLACWFWLGLALDFGAFKVSGGRIDWVQDAPRGLRAFALYAALAVLIVIVAFKVVRRLLVDFSPASLALVLERRFPAILGDRLITAVELADLDRAERQGYSRAMIEQTVREAAERVERVPVSDAFNWQRLRVLGRRAGVLAFGTLILVGGVYSTATGTNPLTDFAVRFKDVSAIWFERNVLLRNTIWPRQAYVELLDFPPSGDLRVGRDAPPPRLRLRAVKWLVADATAPEGWRAMTWDDLTPELLGRNVPVLPPLALAAVPDLSLDRLNQLLDSTEFQQQLNAALPPDGYLEWMKFFERLGERAAEPGMGRRFRLLDVPERVEVSYWGVKTSNEMPIPRGNDQEYAGALGELRESVKFRVRARDYSTPTRTITVVPPPMLTRLSRDEFRPAYYYHRPPLDGGPAALKGLRQTVADLQLSLSGAVSQFGVPAGTDVVLFGTVDKELTGCVMRPMARKGAVTGAPMAITLTDDRLGFRLRFPSLSAPQDFELEFTDMDGVQSRRHVVIDAVRDGVPRVAAVIDGIRSLKGSSGSKEGGARLRLSRDGYMVTPTAMIPFAGTVDDNSALASVDYEVSVQRMATSATAGAQAALVAAVTAHFAPSDVASVAVGTALTAEAAKVLSGAGADARPQTFPLRTFEEAYRERATRDVVLAELTRRIALAPPAESWLIQRFEVKPKFEAFDVRDRLPDLKEKDEQKLQPTYRLKLTVKATDNNVETGPGVGENKEPPFTVYVVSESEFLVEIANDERALHFKMEEAVTRLKDARLKLDKVSEQVPGTDAKGLATMAQRAQEIQDSSIKSRDTVQEVANDYGRLLREMELNRVRPKLIEKVKGDIVFPLESALRGEFVRAEEALEGYRKELEAAKKPDAAASKKALDELIAKLGRVMDAMGEVTTINKLITTLREIEKGQDQDIGAALRMIKKRQEEIILKKLGDIE